MASLAIIDNETGAIESVTLTVAEKKALARYEAVIEDGIGAFVEVGMALMAVRDDELYKAYGTFEIYVSERWLKKRSWAYKMIDGARVVEELKMCTKVHIPAPIYETQARKLVPLLGQPEKLAAAWEEANRRTNGKPTAEAVGVAVQDVVVAQAIEEGKEPAKEPDLWTCIACKGRGYLDHDPLADRNHKPRPATWHGGTRPIAEEFRTAQDKAKGPRKERVRTPRFVKPKPKPKPKPKAKLKLKSKPKKKAKK